MSDITITIKRREKDKNRRNQNKDSKRLLLPTYHGKKGGRRRLKKQTGFINFYDLGQIKSGGNWITPNVSLAPPATFRYNIANPNIPNSYGFDVDDPPDSAYLSIIEGLLPENLSTLKTKARKVNLEDASEFPITVISYSNAAPPENWTENGLRLTETERQNFSLFNSGNSQFEDIYLYAPAYYKITASRDSEAAPVSDFVIAETANIFLMPSIPLLIGFSESVPAPGVLRRHTYGLIYRFKPRFFDAPGTVVEANFPPENIEAFANANAIPPVRSFYFDFYLDAGGNPVTTQGAGGFPSNTEFSIDYNGAFAPAASRYLYAVIEQSNQFFFVWSN